MSDRVITDQRTGEVINDPHIRPFGETLRELGGGATEVELAEGIWDVIQRVRETGKAGSVTLTIKVEPANKKDASSGPLIFRDQVTLKIPEADRSPVFLFTDREGNPTRRNPLQDEIEGLRVVPAPADVRQIPAESTIRNAD